MSAIEFKKFLQKIDEEVPTGLGWTRYCNKNPRPYVWTKIAEQILDTLQHIANELQTQDAR